MTDPALYKLALAVINTAVNDRHLAKRYLARKRNHVARVVVARRQEEIREATAFLVTPSIWHEIINVHPDALRRRLARPDFDERYAAGKRSNKKRKSRAKQKQGENRDSNHNARCA